MLFFEASAKTAESVNQAFITLARKLMSKRDVVSAKAPLAMKKKPETNRTAGTSLSTKGVKEQPKGCC